MSQLFELPNVVNSPAITQQPAELPKLDTVDIKVSKKPNTDGLFESLGEEKGKVTPLVDLQTFRRQHNII
ncbi:MAG: hypothetical protein HY425_03180 [Candidatus Levybacteria bacterium]|nr:hypothetical protein [Candidatus Levybacteria bacterium]